jgi:alkylation response protein AidB-like acyl-CoA dehydrogenase
VKLDLSEDQEFFRQTTRRFIEAEAPIERVRDIDPAGDAFDRRWWLRAAELGWASMLVPESAGGGCLSGRPLTDAAIVGEEMGRQVCPGPFGAVNVVCAALGEAAGSHQAILTQLVGGAKIASWAMAEEDGRWDTRSIATTATVNGGSIVLRGVKPFIEAAPSVDYLLVVARTGDGLSQVLVPSDAEHVSVTRSRSLDLARHFGTATFENVELPVSCLVGEPGEAAPAVERQLQIAIALQCAETVGMLDRVVEFTLGYMQDRFAFGRPIATFQALKHRMADISLWLESAKATTDSLVAAIDDRSPDAARLASVAKSYVGDKSLTIIQECVQFHGGIGVTWEHDLHLYLRRATVNRALLGSPEQHRDRLCDLLGLEVA